jgi:S-adenosylmethionine synthetase
MKRRDFLSVTARTAAALTATPALTASPVIGAPGSEPARHGGVAPRRVTGAGDFVVSAESFTDGHSDKLADLIADTVTDELQGKRLGRFHGGAIHAFACRDLILVGGGLFGPWGPMIDCFDRSFWEQFEPPIRDLLRKIGHVGSELTVNPDEIGILFSCGVDYYYAGYGAYGEPGPGEPVLVYGYATDETPELMPLPTLLAHRLAERLAEARRSGLVPWLLPHGQTKVSVRYAAGEPAVVESVEMRVQHEPRVDHRERREVICEEVLKPVLGEEPLRGETQWDVNPAGGCIYEGLAARWGVSGRSLAADTYGAHCPLPSAGLSGQGTENVQRSGTLMARHLAKHVVAAGLARRCTVHLAYAAARAGPEAVLVDTHGTGAAPEERIEQAILAVFPLTPWGIFKYLDLGRPIYRKASAFGYFGRQDPAFTWEQVDRAAELAAAV